jgi:membrane protein YdbS with pleckstrin-like domain
MTMTSHAATIHITELPISSDFTALSGHYRLANQISISLMFLLSWVGFTLGSFLVSQEDTATGYFLVTFLSRWMGLIWLVYALYGWVADKQKGYCLRNHDLSWRTGLVCTRTVTAPVKRIQHIEVTQGAIDRLFGLAKVVVKCAGHGFTIAGLPKADAELIRQSLLEKVQGEHDE